MKQTLKNIMILTLILAAVFCTGIAVAEESIVVEAPVTETVVVEEAPVVEEVIVVEAPKQEEAVVEAAAETVVVEEAPVVEEAAVETIETVEAEAVVEEAPVVEEVAVETTETVEAEAIVEETIVEEIAEEAIVEETPVVEEAVQAPAREVRITILESNVQMGDTFTLCAELIGYEGCDVSVQWQYNDGNGWQNVDGANGLTLKLQMDEEVAHCEFRLEVAIAE